MDGERKAAAGLTYYKFIPTLSCIHDVTLIVESSKRKTGCKTSETASHTNEHLSFTAAQESTDQHT